ncbi:universal stress protein [Nucisporomicrobium flavum]|uniref:universal stress protein n=1 Tax=Nucisporomicrobium flavum TaxID=2785915 RepID=UPI003C2AB041
MESVTGAPVVVGVDTSPRSNDAVELAAAEAALRHRPLRIVHAFLWPLARLAVPPASPYPALDAFRDEARSLLTDAERLAAKTAPGTRITTEIITDLPVSALLAESRHADLLVVGDRGSGGFRGLVVGSVAVQTATHASCPVLIARRRRDAAGPVIVGIDGSAASQRALEFAAREASLQGVDLVAVHAWGLPPTLGAGELVPLAYELAAARDEEERILAESLAGTAQLWPDVRIQRDLHRGAPARALLGWSRRARLIVVGSRGHGGFPGLLLGSVGQHLIHHAACPVAVVRAAP